MKSLIPILLLCALLAACGSDSPTGPEEDGGNGGFVDTPDIPRPTSPGGTVPSKSEVLITVANQSLARFAPRLIDVQISAGVVRARALTSCDWSVVAAVSGPRQLTSWSNAISVASICDGSLLSGIVQTSQFYPTNHPLLHDAEGWQSELAREGRGGTITAGLNFGRPGYIEMRVVPTTIPDEPPHLKRERYWQLHPLEGGVGDFLLLTGPVTGEVVTSATTGTATTQTETFGRSLGGSVTAGYGPLSATVEASVDESFSTSIEITEETTTTFSRTVHGEEGKTIQFMVWDLIEIYSFSDADGDPYVVDGWEFQNDTLERKVALALDATSFPAR